MEIIFSSRIGKEYKDNLEELLFFNPQQIKIQSKLIEIIEKYGSPKILVEDNFLHVIIEGLQDVQTLYAFAKESDTNYLVGVMIYLRINTEVILVLHLGVSESFSNVGEHSNQMLVAKLLLRLKEIAKKIKGIESIEVLYGQGEIQKIKV